jgi:hypothetical protein
MTGASNKLSPQSTLLLAILIGLFALFSVIVIQVAYRSSARSLGTYTCLGYVASLWLFPWGLLMVIPRQYPSRRALALRTLGCHVLSWLVTGSILFVGLRIVAAALVKDSALGTMALWVFGFVLGAAFGLIQYLGWRPALRSTDYRIAMYTSSVVVGVSTLLVLYVGFVILSGRTTGAYNLYPNSFLGFIALVSLTAPVSTTLALYAYLTRRKVEYAPPVF